MKVYFKWFSKDELSSNNHKANSVDTSSLGLVRYFKGNYLNLMPELKENAFESVTCSQVMQNRIYLRIDNYNLFEDSLNWTPQMHYWLSNPITTASAIVFNRENKFKLIKNAYFIRDVNPQTQLYENKYIELSEELYNQFQGNEYSLEKILQNGFSWGKEGFMKKEDVLTNNVLDLHLSFSTGSSIYLDYVDFMFSDVVSQLRGKDVSCLKSEFIYDSPTSFPKGKILAAPIEVGDFATSNFKLVDMKSENIYTIGVWPQSRMLSIFIKGLEDLGETD